MTRPIDAAPNTADAFLRRGLDRLRAGDASGAIDDLSYAIDRAPDLLEAYQARGDAYRRTKQFARAVADFTRVLESEPDAVDSCVGRARCLAKMGETQRALADFDRALAAFPDAAVYLDRGLLYCDVGDDERGIADLSSAIELNGPVRARLQRGIALSRLKRYEEAITDHNAVLAATASPDERSWALVVRGEALAGLGRHDEAIRDYDAALAIDVEVAAIHHHALMSRAWSYQDTGNLPRAIEDFDELLRRRPDHRSAHGFRAEAYSKMGQWGAALADHVRQRERTPDNPRAWAWVAWFQATCPDDALRDGAEAVANATRACELAEEEDGDALDALAAAFAECGRFDEATATLTKALALSSEDRKEMIARMEQYRDGRPHRMSSA